MAPSMNGMVSGKRLSRAAIHAALRSAKSWASFKEARLGIVKTASRVANLTRKINLLAF